MESAGEDVQKLQDVLSRHSSLSAEEVAKATTAEELRTLWGTRLASMEDPELTLGQFKQFIVILAAQDQLRGVVNDGYITPADAGKMAVRAFRLLDTDQSETISFKEFEVRGLSTEHAANIQNYK